MFFKISACTLLVISALALFTSTTPVDAHSWAACIDWRFKHGKEAWGDDDGECMGFARRFPLGKGFASLDHANPGRHYQQDGDHAPACSDGEHGKDVGSNETRADPPEKAYGGKYGAMTVTSVGKKLCVRWPAKNHAEENESDKLMVLINLAKEGGKDPSQDVLTDSLVVGIPYKNCDKGPVPDERPCGGCFTVPSRAPGIYTLQWRWMLNKGEWYTSCADIKIEA
ncbi:hypothetical protein BG006_001338 [Podila minutissima]|uniref:Uncharacterized protein n=1 Tax=Podila minutissima TaxID=64525 RepID=A0A9P5SNW5_9FUNG|nr:hypothetical protein BG006_001338 [Podila minutissima]